LALVAPFLPAPKPVRRPRTTALCGIIAFNTNPPDTAATTQRWLLPPFVRAYPQRKSLLCSSR
jgi:hypothetical protein